MSYSLQINIFSPKKTPRTAYFKQKKQTTKNHTLEKLKKSIKQELIMQKKNKNQRKEQATQRGYKKDEIIEFESII